MLIMGLWRTEDHPPEEEDHYYCNSLQIKYVTSGVVAARSTRIDINFPVVDGPTYLVSQITMENLSSPIKDQFESYKFSRARSTESIWR